MAYNGSPEAGLISGLQPFEHHPPNLGKRCARASIGRVVRRVPIAIYGECRIIKIDDFTSGDFSNVVQHQVVIPNRDSHFRVGPGNKFFNSELLGDRPYFLRYGSGISPPYAVTVLVNL